MELESVTITDDHLVFSDVQLRAVIRLHESQLMNDQSKIIDSSLERYFRERDRYSKLAERVADIVREQIIEQNAIHAQVTYRSKTVSSLEGKLRRHIARDRHFDTVDQVFREVQDLAAVRVLAYREKDIDFVCDQIKELLQGLNGQDVTIEDMDKSDGRNFYKAKHAVISLPVTSLVGGYENIRDTPCEIQVCSMMAHVWNEIEHDIGYKPKGEPGADETALLTALGHLTRSGDKVISQLLLANDMRLANETDAFASPFDLAARLRKEYVNVDMSRNISQIFEYLLSRDITSPGDLRDYLGLANLDVPDVRLIDDFNAYLEEESTVRYRLDPKTADVLLFQLLAKEAKQIAAAFDNVGRGRPTRMRTLAEAFVVYEEWMRLNTSSTNNA
ncbi:MAG: hypothetical protein FGM32_08140 [Candidatus Kapabacteria bacterium]|nr:hypothetical protein [Candidatus Kapabacteria bacterium]